MYVFLIPMLQTEAYLFFSSTFGPLLKDSVHIPVILLPTTSLSTLTCVRLSSLIYSHHVLEYSTLPNPSMSITGRWCGDICSLAVGSADPTAPPMGILLGANEDVVYMRPSEATNNGLIIQGLADWIEQDDARGLEKFGPTCSNVEILDFSKARYVMNYCIP